MGQNMVISTVAGQNQDKNPENGERHDIYAA